MDGVNTYRYLTDKFNAEHKDVQINLIIEDGKCDGKDAASAAQKLITIDRVQAILWWSCSSETLAAGRIAQQNWIVLVDSVSSAPAISDVWNYIFKYINDNYAGKTLSDYAFKALKSAVLVYDDTDYGVALADVVRKNYQWTIVDEIKVPIDEKDLSLVAKQIKQSNAEGIIVIDQDDTHAIAKIKAFDKEGLLTSYAGKIFGAYFYSSATFLTAVGDLVEWDMQVDVPLIDHLWDKAKQFVNLFEQHYSVKLVASFVVFQWEAMNVILDAINAGNYDSLSIQKYLHAIDETHQRDGLFGKYYFNGSDAVGIHYVIQKIENKTSVIVQ